VDTFNPVAKDSLQFVTRNATQYLRHSLKKRDLVGNLLSDPAFFTFPKR
jgi:hypothetical protein